MDAKSVTVRETLHHGNMRSITETTVPDLSPANVARVLASSPYVYGGQAAARVAEELTATGKGDHGWSRFEVVR